jgi:hypothetical protein
MWYFPSVNYVVKKNTFKLKHIVIIAIQTLNFSLRKHRATFLNNYVPMWYFPSVSYVVKKYF